MSEDIIFIVSLAIVGFVAVCVALEVLPKFTKVDGGNAQRPKYFWLWFWVGCALMFAATYWSFMAVYSDDEVPQEQAQEQKHYNIPQLTKWFFVNPEECKKAIINGVAYDPKTFAKRYECDIEKIEGLDVFLRVDCTEMLNNIFFMVKGEEECGKIHLTMREGVANGQPLK